MPDPIVNQTAPRYIPVARPSLGEAEAAAARAAVMSGWISGAERVAQFEQAFAAAHDRQFGVACNSGASALHLALAVLDIGPDDRVLLPTLTMVAVANAVVYRGATPVFIDVEPETGNADPHQLAHVDRDLKAAIVPHLYGVPAAGFLRALRHRFPRVPVIEDCAEAHYARIGARACGSLGRLACFSFYANKIVTTGEGGMVLTDEPRLADRLRSLRAHAFTPGDHFHHRELAYGYRMTDVQAAIGLVQHERREELLARRAAVAGRYRERLSGVRSCLLKKGDGHLTGRRARGGSSSGSEPVSVFQQASWAAFPARVAGSVWWVFPMLCAEERMRNAARAALAAAGVETRSYFWPLHRQPHLQRFASRDYRVADSLARRGLYLPLWPDMSDADVDYVCDVIAAL